MVSSHVQSYSVGGSLDFWMVTNLFKEILMRKNRWKYNTL